MRHFLLVLLFTALTALCWGIYGPVLREGQAGMSGSHWRPFICVGAAYFVVAIVAPWLLLHLRGEKGGWTARGTFWSLLAGAAGAIGALGVILAFNYQGSPVYVMPLVFGCAPVVNTFYTMLTTKDHEPPSPGFYAGLILVAAGAVTVLVFKPTAAKAPAAAVAVQQADKSAAEAREKSQDKSENSATTPGEKSTKVHASSTIKTAALVTLFVALTALSWGVYGPVLHKGQMLMQGSRLRPLICVGVAYFVIAVIIPTLWLVFMGDHGQWAFGGIAWSLGGGAAGAVGALGIIMAFTFGGKPIYVMPLVFGCAPVINTFVSIAFATFEGQVLAAGGPFYGGLIAVVAGAVTVLVLAPKARHPAPARQEAAKTPEPAQQPG